MQVIGMKINGKEYVIKHIIIYKLLIKLTNKHLGKFWKKNLNSIFSVGLFSEQDNLKI